MWHASKGVGQRESSGREIAAVNVFSVDVEKVFCGGRYANIQSL